MSIFKGQNLLEFSYWFKTDLDCKEYLDGLKSTEGYKCLKCGQKTVDRPEKGFWKAYGRLREEEYMEL